jgi:hypothetical protein
MPAATSASRAASMSATIRYSLAEPGAADVRFVPNWTEHPEPCGVNWTMPGGVTSSLHPETPVELLRAVDIRDREDDHLDLHVDVLGARDPARVVAPAVRRAHRGLPRLCQGTSSRFPAASHQWSPPVSSPGLRAQPMAGLASGSSGLTFTPEGRGASTAAGSRQGHRGDGPPGRPWARSHGAGSRLEQAVNDVACGGKMLERTGSTTMVGFDVRVLG